MDLRVGDNREGGNLGSSSTGRGNAYQLALERLVLLDVIDPLPDVHEAEAETLELDRGVFVHEPDNLSGVLCEAKRERII